VAGNAKLRTLLYNPVVDSAKKQQLLAKIAKEAGFNQYTVNWLRLLVEKDRMSLLEEICEEFEAMYCKMTDTQARCSVVLTWLA
jgi:F-type H+-transporting ATPase subunit delta